MSSYETLTKNRALILRIFVFLVCIPQAGSLLLKVYGICSLQSAFLVLAIPGILFIGGVYFFATKNGNEFLKTSMELGFLGGLAGTIAYDIARIPFLLMGQRVFAPISAYGVWLLDAHFSTRFSELAGWGYHFVNGISFGIMYAMFMRGKPGAWAILWGCGLETIAFLSPFGRIFGFYTNPSALGIAYFGHVIYGVPLGFMLMNDQSVLKWLKSVPTGFYYFGLVMVAAYALGQTILPERIAEDKRSEQGQYVINNDRLSPEWLRITDKQNPVFINKSGQSKIVVVKQLGTETKLESGEQKTVNIPACGVYQLFVNTPGRTHSSFLIFEPVESVGENK